MKRQKTLWLMVKSVWSMEGTAPALAGWRSLSRASGAQFVTMAGTFQMPRLCVDSWAVGGGCLQKLQPVLDKDEGSSTWMISTVAGMNQTSHSVATVGWVPTTAVTMKTLVLSVKVINTRNLWVPVMSFVFCHGELLSLNFLELATFPLSRGRATCHGKPIRGRVGRVLFQSLHSRTHNDTSESMRNRNGEPK